MRILGLDVGSKRIGVAVSDPLGMTAQGVTTIMRESDTQSLEELEKIFVTYQAQLIVVGLPLSLEGFETDQTRATHKFVEKLRKRFRRRAQIETWDERLSTAGAERVLLEADLSRAKRRRVIDKMAAAFILQGYLDTKKNGEEVKR